MAGIYGIPSLIGLMNNYNRFVDKVIVPYFEKERDTLGLPATQKVVLIFDVFAAHRVESVLVKLEQNNIIVIFVPRTAHTYSSH